MIHNIHSTKAANNAKKLQNLDRKIDPDVYSSSLKVLMWLPIPIIAARSPSTWKLETSHDFSLISNYFSQL